MCYKNCTNLVIQYSRDQVWQKGIVKKMTKRRCLFVNMHCPCIPEYSLMSRGIKNRISPSYHLNGKNM